VRVAIGAFVAPAVLFRAFQPKLMRISSACGPDRFMWWCIRYLPAAVPQSTSLFSASCLLSPLTEAPGIALPAGIDADAFPAWRGAPLPGGGAAA
jgi:hypothetical protein